MVARLAHNGAIAHRDATGGEQRHLVALAKRLEHADLADGVDVELGETHGGGNLAAILEVLRRELREDGTQTLAQRIEVLGRAGHAHRPGMPAESDEQVRALLDRLEEVHGAHRATRSARDAVLDGEQERGNMVAIDQATGDDALDSLVPALAAHDDHAAAVVGPLGNRLRLLGQLRLDGAALLVDLLEGGREARRLLGVAGHQQVERERGVGHAARGVETRDEGERERVGGYGRKVRAGDGGEGHIARPRGGAHMRDAVRHESAVFGGERHHVAHRSQRRHLGESPPQVGVAQTLPQHLHELEGNAHTRQLATGAVRGHLGIGDGDAHGNEVRGLMMIGHHDIDAPLDEVANLVAGGYAVVHRDDQRG